MTNQKGSILAKPDYDEIRRVVRDEVKELTSSLATKDGLNELKEAVSHLPTKDDFYSKMDIVLGEVQGLREDFAAHQSNHDRIETNSTNLTHKVKHLYKIFEVEEPTDVIPAY